MSSRITQVSITFEEQKRGIDKETFPAQAFSVHDGVIEITTRDGYVIVPINENLRKVEFTK